MRDLANAYARDHDDYPKTLNAAISMVSSYMGTNERKTTNKYENKNNEPKTSIGFVQRGKQTSNVTCYNCGKKGHYSNECPKKNSTNDRTTAAASDDERSESPSEQTPTRANVFMQAEQERSAGGIQICNVDSKYRKNLKNKILLDTESTHTVFSNAKFVTNIREANSKLEMWTEGAYTIYTKHADLNGYPHPVWFNEEATINTISFSQVLRTPEWFKIEYDDTGIFKLVNKVTKRITKFEFDEAGLLTFTPKLPEAKAEQAKIAGVGGKPTTPKNEDEWKVVTSKRSKHPRSGSPKTRSNERATRVLSNRQARGSNI
jgi:hypothetical protein